MYDFDPERLAKLATLRAEGINPWPTAARPTLTAAEAARLGEDKDTTEALAPLGADFVFAGRLMFKNDMGKAGFGRVLDATGRLQIYVKKDIVGESDFAVWKRLDLGDTVQVRGGLMRTKTGELTLQARAVGLASKCIKSLPDKWHGMEDRELCRRQRYLDLFANEGVREVFRTRSTIVSYIRAFFEAKGFLEVETPMMHPIPGGATAKPFVTHHNALATDLFLRVAPELYLKRLVVGGLERVYEINRNFRNEGIDATHNPEFTMLEFYEAWQNWEGLVALTEELLAGLARHVHDKCRSTEPFSGIVRFGEADVDWNPPFERRAYGELVLEAIHVAGREPGKSELLAFREGNLRSADALRHAYCTMHPGFTPEKLPTTWWGYWQDIFDIDVEKTLRNPTFVTHFPIELSPLARRNDADPSLADRFELFIAGREIANGFNELNDPVDQAERFATQARAAASGDEEAMHFDADYVEALCYGMPPTAGEGIGIDRLAMLLTNTPNIRDVILFPTLRPRT